MVGVDLTRRIQHLTLIMKNSAFLSLITSILFFLFAVLPFAGQAADLSITTTSFVHGANAEKIVGTAGGTLTIGQLLYFDSTAQTWKAADADASVTTAAVGGIAASGAAAGQAVIVVIKDDDMTLGATLSLSAPVYVLSSTAGGIAPVADIGAGEFPRVVIVAKSTTKCVFDPRMLRSPTAAVAP